MLENALMSKGDLYISCVSSPLKHRGFIDHDKINQTSGEDDFYINVYTNPG